MRKVSFTFWTIIVIGFFCFQAAAQDQKSPKMIIRSGVFDAGDVDEGGTIKHTFSILNQGNAPLEIKSVKPG